jgi:predicted O-methyltransferase YrrM
MGKDARGMAEAGACGMKLSIVTPWYGPTAQGDNNLLPDFAAAVAGAEVVVVDNATPPETAAALFDTAGAHGWVYLRNETNAGFAGGNNQGYAAATGDIIIFLNSDIAAPPQFLDAIAHDVRDGALYGPSLQAQLVAGRWLPYLEGWCVAATRATWERLRWLDTLPGDKRGPWDADAYPGPYWEDNDLCLRAAEAGVSLIQTTWPIHHKGGRSTPGLARNAATLERNRATFAARALAAFDALPDVPMSAARMRYLRECQTASDIQHHLPLLHSTAHGRVVEIGTRSGVSTSALLAGVEQRGGRLVSIDIDDCSAHFAGHPLWSFVQADSTDARTVALLQEADALPADVLLLDSLHTYEHLTAELNLWAPHVQPGGVILVHDPETFPGVRRAIVEFCEARGWPVTFVLPCNGMARIEVPE